MKELVAPICYPTLLDIGCGPGIYAERFTKEGYQVTGIDFSKRSIDYALESALRQELSITYLFQDYLQMNLKKVFDFGTMIYCDMNLSLKVKHGNSVIITAFGVRGVTLNLMDYINIPIM